MGNGGSLPYAAMLLVQQRWQQAARLPVTAGQNLQVQTFAALFVPG